MRSISRVVDVSFNTVAKLLADAGSVCAPIPMSANELTAVNRNEVGKRPGLTLYGHPTWRGSMSPNGPNPTSCWRKFMEIG